MMFSEFVDVAIPAAFDLFFLPEDVGVVARLLDMLRNRIDARDLQELSLVDADNKAMQARWRSRLDGDITWDDAPSVAALWLGLPIGTRSLTFDLIAGSWRVNGRPLPEF